MRHFIRYNQNCYIKYKSNNNVKLFLIENFRNSFYIKRLQYFTGMYDEMDGNDDVVVRYRLTQQVKKNKNYTHHWRLIDLKLPEGTFKTKQ